MGERCRCGHTKFQHLNDSDGRIGRHRCTATVRRYFQDQPVELGDLVLTSEQTKIILQKEVEAARKSSNYEQRLAKMLARGYDIITCECQMYHLVDLGQVILHVPGR